MVRGAGARQERRGAARARRSAWTRSGAGSLHGLQGRGDRAGQGPDRAVVAAHDDDGPGASVPAGAFVMSLDRKWNPVLSCQLPLVTTFSSEQEPRHPPHTHPGPVRQPSSPPSPHPSSRGVARAFRTTQRPTRVTARRGPRRAGLASVPAAADESRRGPRTEGRLLHPVRPAPSTSTNSRPPASTRDSTSTTWNPGCASRRARTTMSVSAGPANWSRRRAEPPPSRSSATTVSASGSTADPSSTTGWTTGIANRPPSPSI